MRSACGVPVCVLARCKNGLFAPGGTPTPSTRGLEDAGGSGGAPDKEARRGDGSSACTGLPIEILWRTGGRS